MYCFFLNRIKMGQMLSTEYGTHLGQSWLLLFLVLLVGCITSISDAFLWY